MERKLSFIVTCTAAATLTFAALRLRKRWQRKARQECAATTIQRAWRHKRAHALWTKERLDAARLIQRRWRKMKARARELEEEEIWEANLIGAAHRRVIDPNKIWLYQLVGEGSFGKVWIGEEEDTGNLLAIKQLSKECKDAKEDAANEVEVMEAVGDHEFCLSLLGTFQARSNAYLITDFIIGGDLLSVLSNYDPLPEDCVQFYCAQILMALEYMHSKDIIHSDVKMENLLMGEDGYLVLGDFGLSQHIPSGVTFIRCGTREYMAPEYFTKSVGLTKAVDYWAVGVTVYHMLTGHQPFGGDLTRQQEADFEIPDGVSHEGCHFLTQLLTVDPKERLTHDALEHCWFDDVDLEGIRNKTTGPPIIPDFEELEGEGKRFTVKAASQAAATATATHLTNSEDQDWDEGVWRQLHAAC